MKIDHIKTKTGGWFIGDFEKATHRTKDFEVAVKEYEPGQKEPRHVHKVATEWTVVLFGIAKFNGIEADAWTIIEIAPGESVEFEAVTRVRTLVVKIPSLPHDKYLET